MHQCDTKKRKKNPIEKANVLSLITFFFTWDLFRTSLKNDLNEDHIYDITKNCKSKVLGDRLENEWKKQMENDKPSLFNALLGMFGLEYLIIGLHQLLLRVVITTLQPILLGKFVAFFNPKQTEINITEAYYYAIGLILVCFVRCTCNHNCMFYIQQLSIKARIATCSLLYRSILKLDQASLMETSTGNVVTLLSKDVYSYDLALMFGNDLWIGLIQTVIMTYIMYNAIGLSAFAGVVFMLFLIPIQLMLGKLIAQQKRKCAQKTDERLKLFQEILSTIKIIKMYAWEDFFIAKINSERKAEIKKLRSVFYMKSLLLCLASLSIRVSFYLSALLFFYVERNVTAEKVFVVLSCYLTLRSVLTMGIPNGISYFAEAKISLDRISKLLQTPTIIDTRDKFEENMEGMPSIKLTNVRVETRNHTKIFEGLNLHVTSGIVMLTGSIGSGKSMLLKTILKDLQIKEGDIKVYGTISYASQEPWLFPGTIRQNILFGEPYNHECYERIIKICALESDIARLSHADNTIIVDKGSNLSRGQQARINLARSIYKKADIYLLDDPFSCLDLHVGRFVLNQLKDYLKGKLCVLVTHQGYCLVNADRVLCLKDGMLSEKHIEELIKESDEITNEINYDFHDTNCLVDDLKEEVEESTKLLSVYQDVYRETKTVGKVQWEIYKTYLNSGSGLAYKLFLLVVFILATTFGSFFDYYVKIWIDVEQNLQTFAISNTTNFDNSKLNERNTVQIYFTLLLLGTMIFSLLQSMSFFYFVTKASNTLHKNCFNKIMRASMKFFDFNLIGSILNRFAKDIGIIDEYLPNAYYEVVRIFFILLGILFVIAYTHYLFILYSSLIGITIFILTTYYLPASRSLKRLDGTTRAPMIGHVNASLEGLTTIRATKRQNILMKQFDCHQDVHSSASYMYMMSSRAFGFYLDLICVFYVAAIAFTFLICYPDVIDGNVGLAITQAFGLTSVLQWAIRKLTEVENFMTSVERVVEYSMAKPEQSGGNNIASWPDEGQIEFRSVSLNYYDNSVLNNVSFVIKARDKIGIIGRTGVGKTSMITSLFRLHDINGEIFIDNCNTKSVSLNCLRKCLSIIPQEPVVFTGSVRNNLDPNNEYSDESLWKALDVVRVKGLVKDLNENVGESGSHFSTGQKQLICLARALIRKTKILILDEATANVDPDTDELIQEIIGNNFDSCTILIVAHRINNVINCDKVMVLDGGSLVEFDSPKSLLANQNSRFYNLARESGVI